MKIREQTIIGNQIYAKICNHHLCFRSTVRFIDDCYTIFLMKNNSHGIKFHYLTLTKFKSIITFENFKRTFGNVHFIWNDGFQMKWFEFIVSNSQFMNNYIIQNIYSENCNRLLSFPQPPLPLLSPTHHHQYQHRVRSGFVYDATYTVYVWVLTV